MAVLMSDNDIKSTLEVGTAVVTRAIRSRPDDALAEHCPLRYLDISVGHVDGNVSTLEETLGKDGILERVATIVADELYYHFRRF